MFEQMRGFFGTAESSKADAGDEGQVSVDELRLAAAAILLAAAKADQNFAVEERQHITKAISVHLALPESKTNELINKAEDQVEHQTLDGFARMIRENLSVEHRMEVLSEAWSVIAADHVTSPQEASFAVALRQALGLSMEQALRARKLAENAPHEGFKEAVEASAEVQEDAKKHKPSRTNLRTPGSDNS